MIGPGEEEGAPQRRWESEGECERGSGVGAPEWLVGERAESSEEIRRWEEPRL